MSLRSPAVWLEYPGNLPRPQSWLNPTWMMHFLPISLFFFLLPPRMLASLTNHPILVQGNHRTEERPCLCTCSSCMCARGERGRYRAADTLRPRTLRSPSPGEAGALAHRLLEVQPTSHCGFPLLYWSSLQPALPENLLCACAALGDRDSKPSLKC